MSSAVLVDPAVQLRAAMAEAGIAPSEKLIADGRLRRVHVDGDRRGSRNGWYVLHADGAPAGAFGCHKRYPGQTLTWRAEKWREADPAERQEWRRSIISARQRREAEERAAAEQSAARAQQVWSRAAPADPRHPYLERKQVGVHGIRQSGDQLLVPVRDGSGQIHGIQYIAPDGGKRFKSGTAKVGHYHAIGQLRRRLIVSEGYATGATLHEALSDAVAVAFDAGNLTPVAAALRAKYPRAEIIIAADNDRHTEGNPGTTAAVEAAKISRGRALGPWFAEGDAGTDWNDFAALYGLAAIRARFGEALP